jgi:hypothetical protein
MRIQISLPPETWEAVKEMARTDRRPPRQQVEYLVIQATKDVRVPVLAGTST